MACLWHTRTVIALVFIFISFVSPTSVVTWLPNKSFNLASNFADNKLPCSRQAVVFPAAVQESVNIESAISVSEFILPSDGEILLSEGQQLLFGQNPNDNCTSDGNVYYKDDSTTSWAQPDVWSSPRFNKATPDVEKMPCYDDVVKFPSDAQFTIILPDELQFVSGLIIKEKSLTTEEFRRHILTQSDETQQFVESNSELTTVYVKQDSCKSTAGCPCQKLALNVECKLKYCPPPKCSYPIKPEGHCCSICGGSLIFEIDNLNMNAFKTLVKSVLDSYGSENFVYHIGMLPYIIRNGYEYDDHPKRVQVIVMDKGEYNGASSEVINEISHQMSDEWIKNEKTLFLSGSPSSKSGLGGKIAVSMFFAVLLVMGALFAYYYRTSEIKLPDLRGGATRSGVLSRFQRRSESVVSLTRRDSSISGISAFRNPLYDSKRGRVQVTESVLEE